MDEAGLVGNSLSQGKNDNNSGGNFRSLFLGPTKRYCLTVNECGIKEEHKNFQRFLKDY